MARKRTEAGRKAVVKYQKERTKQIGVRFFPADTELYDFAKSHDNVNGYIKGLIRADMERGETDDDEASRIAEARRAEVQT